MAKLPKALESLECPEGSGIYIVIGPGYWGRCFSLRGAYENALRSGMATVDPYAIYFQSEADIAARIQEDGPPLNRHGSPDSFLPTVCMDGSVSSYGIEGCQMIARRKYKARKLTDVRSYAET